MNPFIALFLYLIPAAFLPVSARKGIGLCRGFYGVVCVLSLLGTFFFFMASVAPVHLVPSMSSSTVESARKLYSDLAAFCGSVSVGSLLGICVYRKPISGPKSHRA
jgi:hypothetical protein